MSNPLTKKLNDLGVRQIDPKSPTDARVPLAREFALSSDIQIQNDRKSRLHKGWLDLPSLVIEPPRTLRVVGKALLPIYPGALAIDAEIVIPALLNAAATIKEELFVSLVGLSVEVGEEQDPVLGKLNFQYLEIDPEDPTIRTVTSITKENARRVRAFWMVVLSVNPLTPEAILNGIGKDNNNLHRLVIASTSDTGFTLPVSGESLRIYAKDPLWAEEKAYTVDTDTMDIIEVCRLRRQQNYTDRGYTWGYQGEEPFDADYNVLRTATPLVDRDLEYEVYERAYELLSGKPDHGALFRRAVQNLTSGPAAGNPGNPGEAASSPNGSVCLGNDQRLTFSNQQWLQKHAMEVICTSNNGQGNAVISYCLNTTAPAGTVFSTNPADHKIYGLDGVEWSSLGVFQNAECGDSIMWTAGDNVLFSPGDEVFFVPGVIYPAGSGFSIPFQTVEKVWLNGVSLNEGNIRNAYGGDIEGYENPAEGELYIVLYGPERAAIHKIYKKIVVTSNEDGVAIVPALERGCFAYIEGIAEIINSPVKTGLLPTRQYSALIYHPPFSLETWQFQLKYPEYQGSGEQEPNFLEGAIVSSRPYLFLNGKGGGQGVFQGDAATQFRVSAMMLPAIANDYPIYSFNVPVHVQGQSYPGPVTLNEHPLLPASGLAMPNPGQLITLSAADNPQPQHSLSVRVFADGKLMGFRPPALASSSAYQAVLFFAVEKGGERRLVVATHNGLGAENVPLDSDQTTAIDTFRF